MGAFVPWGKIDLLGEIRRDNTAQHARSIQRATLKRMARRSTVCQVTQRIIYTGEERQRRVFLVASHT